MPSKIARYLYWDSNVLIDYISGTPGRAEEIRRVWDELTKEKDNRVVTSVLSIAEVAHANEEKLRAKLDPGTVAQLDELWNDPNVLMVEMPPYLTVKARDLMRDATSRGWALKPGDAIHLATAMWVHAGINPISEFNTYDDRLHKYVAITGFPIKEPELTIPQQVTFLQNPTDN